MSLRRSPGLKMPDSLQKRLPQQGCRGREGERGRKEGSDFHADCFVAMSVARCCRCCCCCYCLWHELLKLENCFHNAERTVDSRSTLSLTFCCKIDQQFVRQNTVCMAVLRPKKCNPREKRRTCSTQKLLDSQRSLATSLWQHQIN